MSSSSNSMSMSMSAREISGSRSPFQARLEISKSLEKMMVNVSLDMVLRVVEELSELYNFDSCEAIELLGLDSVEVIESKKVKKSAKKVERVKKVKPLKPAFQLPFTRGCEDCCEGLRKSQGLYTQCHLKKRENSSYCNGCEVEASKNANGKPDSGTVGDRLSCGLNDYRSPSGKQVVAYAKVMQKLGLSKEQVLEEASRLGLEIDEEHFEMPSEAKKGRPKAEKPGSVSVSEDKKKGRPKKSKKVLEVETNDIFAELVAAASSSESESEEDEPVKCSETTDKETENEAAKQKKETEKAAKEAEKQKKEAEKAAKEAEKAAKEAEKQAKIEAKEAEKAAKEAEKKKKEDEKAAKEAEKKKKEAEKAAKEAEKKQKVTEKPSKEAEKKQKVTEKKEEEPIKVVIINAKGQTKKTGLQETDKKFLKSSAGEILSFKTQETIGMWNAAESRIEFSDDYVESDEEDEDSEEEAEEYDD